MSENSDYEISDTFVAALWLLFIVGMLGNLSVCIIIVRNKSLHTVTNCYLFNLAISDMIIIIDDLLLWLLFLALPRNMFGITFFVTQSFGAFVGFYASIFTITCFSFERYIAICHPFTSHKITELPRTVKIIAIIWISAICLSFPAIVQCLYYVDDGHIARAIHPYMIYISTYFLVTHFAPTIFTVILYIRIFLKLKESNNLAISGSQNDQTKVIKLLGAVVIVLLVSWSPSHIYDFYFDYTLIQNRNILMKDISKTEANIRGISQVLFFILPTIANPVLYNIMSNKFRKAFKETCCM